MKTLKLLIILLTVMAINNLKGQELADNRNSFAELKNAADDVEVKIFEFNVFSFSNELAGITSDEAGNHYLGTEISRKLYLLDEYYTYRLPLSPGSPTTKKMVKKPLLYSAVKKIERQLKNDVSKERITLDAARSDFNRVLDVAICLVNLETGEFEGAIRASEKVSELINLFTRQVLLNYVS